MYWDALTATGVFISILLVAGVFYLILRERPVMPQHGKHSPAILAARIG